MESSSNNPLEDIARGATKGILDKVEEKINSFIKQLSNKNAFVFSGRDYFDTVVGETKTSEYSLYKKYLKDPKLKTLALAGLTMRKLRKDNYALEEVKKRLVKSYGKEGKYIAFFVENKFLSKFILKIVVDSTDFDIQEKTEKLLTNLDNYSYFVNSGDTDAKLYDKLFNKLRSSNLEFFIVSAAESTVNLANKVIEKLKKNKTIKDIYAPTPNVEKDSEDLFAYFERRSSYKDAD